jgi:hypothetical protein
MKLEFLSDITNKFSFARRVDVMTEDPQTQHVFLLVFAIA